jgi:hypothetical protein
LQSGRQCLGISIRGLKPTTLSLVMRHQLHEAHRTER